MGQSHISLHMWLCDPYNNKGGGKGCWVSYAQQYSRRSAGSFTKFYVEVRNNQVLTGVPSKEPASGNPEVRF